MNMFRLVLVSAIILIMIISISGTLERPDIGVPSFVAGFMIAILVVKIFRR
ncbi:MAG: hypothetical protein H5T33_05600 [Candidatus Methanosuratus sp.]|nr:hypothetical protein [Candidatus Methanosuratincola sp.]